MIGQGLQPLVPRRKRRAFSRARFFCSGGKWPALIHSLYIVSGPTSDIHSARQHRRQPDCPAQTVSVSKGSPSPSYIVARSIYSGTPVVLSL